MLLKGLKVLVREQDEAHLLDLRTPGELLACRLERNLGCARDRVAVDTGRDRRECDGPAAELVRDFEGAAVAGSQEFCFALVAAVLDRANGVDDVLRGKLAGGRRFCIADLAAAKRAAFGE